MSFCLLAHMLKQRRRALFKDLNAGPECVFGFSLRVTIMLESSAVKTMCAWFDHTNNRFGPEDEDLEPQNLYSIWQFLQGESVFRLFPITIKHFQKKSS